MEPPIYSQSVRSMSKNLDLQLAYKNGGQSYRTELLIWCLSLGTWVLSHLNCVWLCDPMNSSPPGSSVHGILQARSGLLYPPPGDLPDPGIEPASCIAGGFLTADATSPSGIIRPLQTKQCPVKTGKARNQSSHCYGLSMLLPYMGCSIWRWGIRLKAQLFRLEGVKQLEMSLITLHVSRPSK